MSPMPQRQNKWVSGWAGVLAPGPQVDLRWLCVWEGLLMLHFTDIGRHRQWGSRHPVNLCQGSWAGFSLPTTAKPLPNQLGLSTFLQPSLHPTVEPRGLS